MSLRRQIYYTRSTIMHIFSLSLRRLRTALDTVLAIVSPTCVTLQVAGTNCFCALVAMIAQTCTAFHRTVVPIKRQASSKPITILTGLRGTAKTLRAQFRSQLNVRAASCAPHYCIGSTRTTKSKALFRVHLFAHVTMSVTEARPTRPVILWIVLCSPTVTKNAYLFLHPTSLTQHSRRRELQRFASHTQVYYLRAFSANTFMAHRIHLSLEAAMMAWPAFVCLVTKRAALRLPLFLCGAA